MAPGRFCLAAALGICMMSLQLQVTQAGPGGFYKGRAVPVKRPHILNIVLSELAWGDVAWNYKKKDAGKALSMDYLNQLREGGITIERYYTDPFRTESLAASQTGMYAYRLGVKEPESNNLNFSLPLNHKILPEYLQDLGYSTHLAGYWGLGFCDKDRTPLKRGYDTFYGYLGINVGYFVLIDFWNGTEHIMNIQDRYKAELLSDRAVSIINNHKKVNDYRPLYIHLAPQALSKPLQGSGDEVCKEKCANIKTDGESADWIAARKIRCEMACSVDKGVKKVMDAFKAAKYDQNLLVVFSAMTSGSLENGASYGDLRGSNGSVYEGGTRVPAFMYSPTLLESKNTVHKSVIHSVDWVPTLLSAAKQCEERMPQGLDGMDMWKALLNQNGLRHDYFVYSIDTVTGEGAIGSGKFKLIRKPNDQTNCQVNDQAGCDQWELYKIGNKDPETKNLVNKKKKKLDKMIKEYERLALLAAPRLPLVDYTQISECYSLPEIVSPP